MSGTRSLLLFLLLLLSFSWLSTSGILKRTKAGISCNQPKDHLLLKKISDKLLLKATEAKTFVNQKGFNDKTCFLVDMSMSSGQNRFFVYDLSNDSILLSGLVAHGSCDDGFQISPSFSNTVNSGCSSLGKYKIGGPYQGSFGLAYKLYGLDALNSNAYKRNIVLHSYECVPENETDPIPICNSRGCPMTSPGFLKQLKTFIDQSKKPVLLWMFDK